MKSSSRTYHLLALATFLTWPVRGGELEIRAKDSNELVATIDANVESEIEIDGKRFKVIPKAPQSERKARLIKLPEVVFDRATLSDVVGFLNARQVEAEGWKKPFNIVLAYQAEKEPEVTLNLENISFYSVLTEVARQTRTVLSFSEEVIEIRASPTQE
jgi:hypothetical protein